MIQQDKRTLIKSYRQILIICSLICIYSASFSQPLTGNKPFTRQDTLRGTVSPERAWWDVQHYAIEVEPEFENKTIRGTNIISFEAIRDGQKMQIDLQEPMKLLKAVVDGKELRFSREGNVYWIDHNQIIKKGTRKKIILSFSGKPREAIRPPWDGGWIWKKDEKGNPWMSVACQGLGASVWYPNKDHQSDEPDSASLTMIVPHDLFAVGNGRLRLIKPSGNKKVYSWAVTQPINNYNIIPYIGRYAKFSEAYNGENGVLDCSYYVLDYNLEKAKAQFQQVKPMLSCFEKWFGPYPFYEDGYKLVESPHLGMEHQSAVAYGNKYMNGYLGRDLSGSGWGEKFDFIIIHESGHEWFGNNITSKDLADMWIHESFTNYSETIFVGCQYGVEAGNEYCIGTRRGIQNDIPIIGTYGVNHEGSGDMYSKGGNMIHTIRQLIGDDEKFRSILRGLNKQYYHSTVTSSDIESYMSKESGLDLSKVFDQYLRSSKIPVLEYMQNGKQLKFRWNDCVKGFDMKLKTKMGEWINPTTEWKSVELKNAEAFQVDPNFYIKTKSLQ